MPVTNLPLHRHLTKSFIAVNPVTIVLVPRIRVKKPAGGWAWEEQAPRPPQVFSIIEPGVHPRPTVTADGIERTVEFYLLGEWDAQIDRGDVFSHQGKDWEVVEMYYENGYERRAMVDVRG